jgi:hypothetical protein
MSVWAQNMKSVFVLMPDSIAPLFTKVNKEDCIDFLDSGMKAVVTNRFGKKSEMKVLSDDYVLVQSTESSTLEMKLLPLNDSIKVVCMVKTVCASACDSEIHFYTSDWNKELAVTDFLVMPDIDMFFLSSDSAFDDYDLIRKKVDMHLVKASLSKDDASLTFIYTTPDYLNKDDREKLLPYLRKGPIALKWQDGKFR